LQKGTSPYDHRVLTFRPTQDMCIQPVPEEFVDITDKIVPNIKPYYMISNYGRLWHKYQCKLMIPNLDSKGYLFRPLSTVNGTVACRIHRLVMMSFAYIPNCENLQVNHKDGIKSNNAIWNLEWVTPSENANHAVQTGLNQYRYATEEQVHAICKLLEEGSLTIPEIAQKVQIGYQTVAAIQSKRTHRDISDQYNIPIRKVPANLTDEQIHLLCKFFEGNKKPINLFINDFCSIALKNIGINDPTANQIRTANKIYTKQSYVNISKNYKF
jgi:hypothetical protein